MKNTLLQMLSFPRKVKQGILVVLDLIALPILLWMVLALRYDMLNPPILPTLPLGWLFVAIFGVAVLKVCGVYRAVVRAFDEKFLQDILLAVGVIVAGLFIGVILHWLPMPRSTPFTFGFFIFLWIWASRSIIRRSVRLLFQLQVPVTRVAIYGAGSSGRQTFAALRAAPEYFVVAFFDDDASLVGTTVQGLRVYAGKDFARINQTLEVDEVLIALPSASRACRREVIERLEPLRIRVRSLPGFTQLVNGQVSISDIHEVDVADLLGRDAVPPSPELMAKDVTGKRVMVTGAGGSIGSELCRQLIAAKPSLLILWELTEYALYHIEQELKGIADGVPIVPILGSVLHQERMTNVLKHYQIDTVYHAAAYKHVPLVEWNPFEGIVNNSVGTLRSAKSAVAAGVSTFVLISTDKAVRPTNVMGASKRLAELALQALAAQPDVKTRFCMVRFGNVLGSSGSVVPLFREQIAKGGPVTVTHPDVTRYFMTIPEASQLVIQAGAMGKGGDVFVLDMGEPVRIVDLARKMINLSGMSSRDGDGDGDIEIRFSGLRPGEKLYEELLIGSNVVTGTEHPRIMRAVEALLPMPVLEQLLDDIHQAAQDYDVVRLKELLMQHVEGYVPDMNITGMMPINS
ncbi:MAG: nucleoside-diphosphate sugar epimerase/dehydratase [Agitococcus sp.]|nr:nucleoside-diphosphate sugar epimerase/dehydratase [Agitococcus sp.]